MSTVLQVSPVRCDQFLEDADAGLAFRLQHDVFPTTIDPQFVAAADATYMRSDDWIVGVLLGGKPRCYPAHMLDNYHVVNDTIAGQNYAIMHCEVCSSNAVYLTNVNGKRMTFGTGGLYGGTLAVFDIETKSLWSHGMGVCFDGPLAGTSLERVESFQASYAEWLALHPDTEVMVWPNPRSHPDPRHGHGTDVWFGVAGIEPLVLRTMSVTDDERLPENEMVVSLFTPEGHGALPIQDVIRAGGLLYSTIGGNEYVTLSGGSDSGMTGTYHQRLADPAETPVALELRNGRFIDRNTGSRFRVDGIAVSGPLAGHRLQPLPTMTNKWHSLVCFIPDVTVIRYAGAGVPPDGGPLAPVFDQLRSHGYTVTLTRRRFALELPHEAHCGYDLSINDEPFQIFLFSDESVARDQLLWTAHALHAGQVVIASTPPLFSDWTNTRRRPARAIPWSPLVADPGFQQLFARAAASVSGPRQLTNVNLSEFVAGLRARGLNVVVERASYRETLPVGARSGARVTIEGDPFLILRFDSAEAAAQAAPLPRFSVLAEHILVQSDPIDIYAKTDRMTDRRPDEVVSWSVQLRSSSFSAALRDAARNASMPVQP